MDLAYACHHLLDSHNHQLDLSWGKPLRHYQCHWDSACSQRVWQRQASMWTFSHVDTVCFGYSRQKDCLSPPCTILDSMHVSSIALTLLWCCLTVRNYNLRGFSPPKKKTPESLAVSSFLDSCIIANRLFCFHGHTYIHTLTDKDSLVQVYKHACPWLSAVSLQQIPLD